MVIYSVYVISKSGGLIYSHDNVLNNPEVEKTFSYPLDLKFDYVNQRVVVTFGQRDGIRVGYSILAINGTSVNGRKVGDEDILDDILPNESRYPINIKLGIPRLTANEKIVLASMFHSMYAIAAIQLSERPAKTAGTAKDIWSASSSSSTVNGSISTISKSSRPPPSSGIQLLETENFRLNCFQTLTGVKFIVISDLSHSPSLIKDSLLKRLYELYADFALKNPFYSLDMPIRCELFDEHLKATLESHEKQVAAMASN